MLLSSQQHSPLLLCNIITHSQILQVKLSPVAMMLTRLTMVLLVGGTRAFSPLFTPHISRSCCQLSMDPSPENEFDLRIPLSFNEMVRQASSAMSDAYEAGMTRQILRVLLPRDPSSGRVGRYFETDAQLDTQDLILAPPDETWQGGIMQLYRACSPTCVDILKRYAGSKGGVPPRFVEDRSVDESGADGIGLWMTQGTTPSEDLSCFVQPSQETIEAIESISQQAGERLVALLNPQWRNVDDALDAASKEGGFFGNFASFLGGKGNVLRRLEQLGFENIYTLEGYVCKGGNVRLLKRFDSDWGVFAENDAGTDFLFVGSSSSRPTYQEVDEFLNKMGISLKYARDIGLAPKL